MTVILAFAGLVVIWSTTALAINWSLPGVGFMLAVTARTSIGAVVCSLLLWGLGQPFPWSREALRVYLVAGLGLYGSMLVTYWGAQWIASGVMSVLFGLSPLITALFALFWLTERLNRAMLLGLMFSMLGLLLIFHAELATGPEAWKGLAAVMAGVVIQALALVWVKRIQAPNVSALATTTGTLWVAMMLYWLTTAILAPAAPSHIPLGSAAAIVYLGVIGSCLGFTLYFYLVQQLTVNVVTLITLITPVLALWLGRLLNREMVGVSVWVGTLCIVAGLAIHQHQALQSAYRRGVDLFGRWAR